MTLSLDLLIAGARATAEATARAKDLRAKAKVTRQPKEAADLGAEASAIQATIDWRATALILRVVKWQCACGGMGSRPDGLFLHQEHTRMANSYRFIRPPTGPLEALPRRTQYLTEVVTLCERCSADSGFSGTWVEPASRPPVTRYTPRPGPGLYTQQWEVLTAPLPEAL